MKKEKEGVYTLTLKGWLSSHVGDVDRLIDELKVFMYEFKKNAIILEDGSFNFEVVEKVKERKKK